MTVAPGSRTLSIVADLQLEVGDRRATLTGADGRLVLRSDTPQMFLQSLREVALPDSVGSIRSVGKVADTLRQYGVALHVEGPAGTIAQLGSGAHSWWGKGFTGSNAIQIGSLRSLRPLLPALFSASRRRTVAVSSLGAAAIVVAVAVARRRIPGIGRAPHRLPGWSGPA